MSRLPRLRSNIAIVDGEGKPLQSFQLWLQRFAEQIEAELGALAAAQAAEAAADAAAASAIVAQAAAATASTEAATAQTAADDAQTSADGANSVAALTASGVTGCTITATDAGTDVTIAISAHTRVYGDGDTLAIAGPTNLTGRAYSTTYFIYYDDPTRADTTPSYQTTTSEATAAQAGDRHLVGKVLTPAAAAPPETGDYVGIPGVGGIIP